MYVINPKKEDKFKCGELIARYLNEEVGIPVFGSDEKYYYFVNNQNIKNALNNAPYYIKIYLWLEGNNWRKEG